MSRRNGLLACVVGLSAALLVGCSSPTAMGVNPRDHIPNLPDLHTGDLKSPYHQQPNPAALPPNKIKPVTHDAPPTDPPPLKKEETPPILPSLPTQPSLPARPMSVVPPPQESKKIESREEPLVAALRAYMQKHPADALDSLARYPKDNQDMLLV